MIPIIAGEAAVQTASLFNDILGLGPVILLFFAAMAVLLIEAMTKGQERWHLAAITCLSIFAAMALVVDNTGTSTIFSGMVSIDAYGRFFSVMFGIAGVLVVLLSPDYLKKIGVEFGEYYSLVLFHHLPILEL